MLKYDGNIFFLADFDDGMESEIVVPLLKEIQKQRMLAQEFRRIDLYINSFGGYAHLVYQLVSAVEIAKRADITVRTIVPSVAYSAGSILAVAGTPGERYIERTAKHLLHYGTTGSMETTPVQLERNFRDNEEHFKGILSHYKKYADVPDLEEKMQDDQFKASAQQCIKWGLADKFMEKFDIGYPDSL